MNIDKLDIRPLKYVLPSLILCAWFLLVPLSHSKTGTLSVKDDSNRLVVLDKPATRIVSLAPHITELLYAIGAGDLIVGTVSYSNYPESAKTIPRVGGYEQFDFEQIALLNPDLVIGWQSGNPLPLTEKLEKLGYTLFLSEPRTLADIPDNMMRLGVLTGQQAEAEAATEEFNNRLGELQEQYSQQEPVRVFYQVWHSPVMTLSGDHLFSKVLNVCSGENIFADLDTLAPKVSEETVITRNPQAIVASGTSAARPDWLDMWQQWPAIEAVRNNHLFHINPDYLQRHTPRVLEGTEQLCKILQGVREEMSTDSTRKSTHTDTE